jgi:hypothetical protein
VPWAFDALTGAILALTVVDRHVLENGVGGLPRPIPLIVVSTLLLGLGVWRRGSWRCLFGALGLIAGLTIATAGDPQFAPFRWLLAYHLVLLSMLLIGASFDDELGRGLRSVAPVLATLIAVAVLLLPIRPPGNLPLWVLTLYPLVMAITLAAYGFWLWHPLTLVMSATLLGAWLMSIGWAAYRYCRQFVVGLDFIFLGLLVFPVAFAISLGKSGVLSRWYARWREERERNAEG